MAFFRDLKDRFLERTAIRMLNRSLVAPYGRVLEFKLDTTSKTAEALVALDGEAEPVRVTIGRYEIFRRDDRTFLTVHDVTTSRAWMTAVAEKALAGRALPLPAEFGGMLARLV